MAPPYTLRGRPLLTLKLRVSEEPTAAAPIIVSEFLDVGQHFAANDFGLRISLRRRVPHRHIDHKRAPPRQKNIIGRLEQCACFVWCALQLEAFDCAPVGTRVMLARTWRHKAMRTTPLERKTLRQQLASVGNKPSSFGTYEYLSTDLLRRWAAVLVHGMA